MECNKPKNLKKCNCSYEPCSRKGTCCECIQYHLHMQELPACCFPDDIEQTYDRSFQTFAQAVMSGKMHNR
jgi:phage gp36-like protein